MIGQQQAVRVGDLLAQSVLAKREVRSITATWFTGPNIRLEMQESRNMFIVVYQQK